MPKKQEKDEFSFTVCGEFFPEVYPSYRSSKWSRGGEDPLVTEMRLFCACMRWAFNRLLEGTSRDEIKKLGQELFGLNSRYADDARLKAQGVLDSQKKLLELEIEETEKKLGRARKKLGPVMRKLAKAEEKGATPEVIEKLRLAVKGRNNRVASLEKKLAELEVYRENGTVPRVVFGGRKLWKRVSRGRATREEWQATRKNRLYSRGDETKGSNPNIKVTYRDGEFHLAVTVSHLSEKVGEDVLGRPKMNRAPRVEGRLWLPEKHRELVRIWLTMRLPYTVELIRTLEGRYIVHLTFNFGRVQEPDFAQGCLALDTNPDGVALCNVNASGQPEPWPEGFSILYPGNPGKYEREFQVITYPNGFLCIKVPDLTYASGFRRDYLIGVLAKLVVDIALFLGKPITLEGLDFGKDRLDTSKKFNRMASNFPFAKMVEAMCRRAVKEGVSFKVVAARHTSTIGYWKYMKRYAVPVHCAAALVIGRRAMGFKERITKEMKQLVNRIKQNLTWKVNPDIPREGKGMTRKVRACLRQLDRKLPVHNGFAPWQQEAYYSVWHDLKLLALSLR
ncbi:IS200/IS605 family element transposase accessory protein TnpB [Carboxydothermus hydrogenoformans]|uniref:ISChy7, transposase n=1 Tax=Carboxydothermus hydrogenoformans (strain ATCC BAA-161 / DSM 6008 / Z-2901) TaxID=246194 RepID=Q3AF40_CARHZ|nr:IS200/IS605 family element transposase accessory protein TnpB [Carboxydothermus hydrogenoformans]ABB15826.1 ISChy7, transposase [Carboxydothermus hydrogenoformans Z-2901]